MITTASSPEGIRALHAEAATASERRRRARWRAALQLLGLVLLLAAIAS